MPKRVKKATAATGAEKAPEGDPYEYYPTPPWCTRALFHHVLPKLAAIIAQGANLGPWERDAARVLNAPSDRMRQCSAMDMCAGEGYMTRPLTEYCGEVWAGDVKDYHYRGGDGDPGNPVKWAGLQDFHAPEWQAPAAIDLYCTNLPFSVADEFLRKMFGLARFAVAHFIRVQFGEGQDRAQQLFTPYPPDIEALFSERCNLVQGTVDPAASRPTAFMWQVWLIGPGFAPKRDPAPVWPKMLIPPCRARLERRSDYAEPTFRIKPKDRLL